MCVCVCVFNSQTTGQEMYCERIEIRKGGTISSSSHEEHVFCAIDRWGPNQIVNVVISQLFFQIRALKTSESSRAPTLIIQADNSVPEHKNKFVLGFLSLLVIHGWYQRVFYYFMLQGHTYAQIDSTLFKPLNSKKHKDDFFSSVDLLHTIPASHFRQHKPVMVYMRDICDWKSYLEPHLSELHGHTSPHAFLISWPGKELDSTVPYQVQSKQSEIQETKVNNSLKMLFYAFNQNHIQS